MSDTVAMPSAAHLAMAQDWRLITDLLGGTRAMRAAAETWLPREPAESVEAYRIRLGRSYLYPALRRTVDVLAGKLFLHPIVLREDVPDALRGLAEDLDLGGRNLTSFARDVFADALAYGVAYVLVDHPKAGDGAPRPYCVHVPAANVIGWRVAPGNGAATLARVRIRERVPAPSSAWDDDGMVDQIRVLEPGRYQLWRPIGRDRGWAMIEEGETSLPVVPLIPVYTQRTGFMTARPPLIDLAWLNLAHWQSASDQRNILRIARVGLLVGTGIDPGELGDRFEIGPNRLVLINNPAARLAYVEHNGNGVNAGRQDLVDLKEDMASIGADLLARRPGGATATARAIDSAEADSALGQMALGLEDALENIFATMAHWLGMDDGGSLVVNRDFGIASNPDEIQTLLKLREAGGLSRAGFLTELKRRGVLPDDFDLAGDAEALAAEQAEATNPEKSQ